MRIIINTTELLQDSNYKSLTKEESDTLLSIITLFAEEDKQELPIDVIKAKFNISNDFMDRTSFCLFYGKIVKVKKYFTWFKSNRSYVAKSRKKEVHVVKDEVKVFEKTKQSDDINYDRIMKSFNEAFKDTKLKSKHIKDIGDDRKKLIKKLYGINGKKLNGIDNIYDFYEAYWELIKDVGEEHHNHVSGWPFPAKKDGWFHPSFKYYIEGKPFLQIETTMKENS